MSNILEAVIFPNHTVTVLISAYNAAPFLHRAVESALNQTFSPLEIIIIDDASTDATLDVAKMLAQTDPRICVLARGRNGGPAAARNTGIENARGDWIAILDADDAFLPDRLERLIAIAIAENADVIVDNFFYYDSIKNAKETPGIIATTGYEPISFYQFIERARPYNTESDWGLLKPVIRRKLLLEQKLRYPDFSRHGEDFLLMVTILLANARFIVVRVPGHLYTKRSCGLSRTQIDYKKMIFHSIALLQDARIHTDKRLKNAIHTRVRALRKLHAEYEQRNFLNRGKYIVFVCSALSGYRKLEASLRIAGGKVKAWIRSNPLLTRIGLMTES